MKSVKKNNSLSGKIFRVIFTLIIFGICNSSLAQPSFIFGKQFGTDKEDSGQDIVTLSSGDFVLAGTTFGNLCTNDLGKVTDS